MVIDSGIINNNWFLNIENQRKYYNNGKYLGKVGFSIDIIEFSISCIFWYYWLSVMVGIIVYSIIVGTKIWFNIDWNKVQRDDCFDIRKGMKATVIVFAFFSIVSLIAYPSAWWLFWNDSIELVK